MTAMSSSITPRTDVQVPQPVPTHDGSTSGTTTPAAPGDTTPLLPTRSVERFSVGHAFVAGGIGAASGALGGFLAGLAMEPNAFGPKSRNALLIGPVLGAAIGIGIGWAVAAARGHSYLTARRDEQVPGYDAERAEAAIAAGLVGASATMQANDVTLHLDKLVGTTTSLASADAALYDKRAIDGVRDGSAPQRVVIALPRLTSASPATYATYEASTATGASTDPPGTIAMPDALRQRGARADAVIAGSLYAADVPSAKTETRGNEIWQLRGVTRVVERLSSADDDPQMPAHLEDVAAAPWRKQSERFLKYTDVGGG